MKISINCSSGSRCTSVVKLNGEPAIKGIDFIEWDGAFHKNGKWSYTEGGIALKNGVYSVKERSTHSRYNNITFIAVIENDLEVAAMRIGKVPELDQYPKFDGEYADAMKACFEAYLSTCNGDSVKEYRSKWEQANLFY